MTARTPVRIGATFTPRAAPPRLTRRSPRSWFCNDLDQLRAELRARGGLEAAPKNNEAARLHLLGGLALLYSSGSIVAAGDDPRPLVELLASWEVQP